MRFFFFYIVLGMTATGCYVDGFDVQARGIGASLAFIEDIWCKQLGIPKKGDDVMPRAGLDRISRVL